MIKIPVRDLWVMLLSTIRYSMHRQTYMPSLCLEYVKIYGGYLSEHELEQIASEIVREVELHGRLGADCDHRIWMEVASLARQIAQKKA